MTTLKTLRAELASLLPVLAEKAARNIWYADQIEAAEATGDTATLDALRVCWRQYRNETRPVAERINALNDEIGQRENANRAARAARRAA